MLLCFTPKSIGALPEDLRKAWDQLGSVRDTDVALVVPLGDRALRTRRTIFTVIRGPHIHKTSREQFQRLVHRRVINFPTTSHEELQWFLDALKSYDFTGIQIQVKLGSSSFLMPPPLPDPARAPAAPARPLLAGHMARFPHLFPAAALGGGAPSSSGGSSAAAMARDFEQSFATARADLVWERLALQQLPAFQSWLRQQNPASLAAAADAAAQAAGGDGGLAAIGRAVAREAAGAGGWEGAEQLQDALAAAAARVLADPGLPRELTGTPCNAAALLARTPLADLSGNDLIDAIYRSLAEGKRLDEEQQQLQQQQADGQPAAASDGGRRAAAAVEAYGDVARALVQQLLAAWWAAAGGRARDELMLPGTRKAGQLLQSVLARRRGGGQPRDAADGGGGGRAGVQREAAAAAAAATPVEASGSSESELSESELSDSDS